jgi:aspartate/methionine/tyrosine aminotransferase
VEEYYSSKLREVRQLTSEGKPIINMGIGSPDLSPSPLVIDAITAAMHDDNAQYQSYQCLNCVKEWLIFMKIIMSH